MKKTAIIPSSGKTKVGTVLISLFNGQPFIITGGKKGMSSGPAHLASMLHGWNYTGTETIVIDYNDITDDELNHMCGGRMENFRKAQTNDVVIECIELLDMQLRERKTEDEKIQQIMNDQKKNPDNHERTGEFIKSQLDEMEKKERKPADQRIADAESEGVPIWSIFGIEKSRAEILIKEFDLHWKKIESNAVDVMTKELENSGGLCVHILPHHIHDYFENHLSANEYGFVMFICGQSFYALQKQMESFVDLPLGRLAKIVSKHAKRHGVN